jgi:hypothetical protein
MTEQHDWDFEPMSDEELAGILELIKNTNLDDLTSELIVLYQKIRSEVADDEVPAAFKPFITDELLNDDPQ